MHKQKSEEPGKYIRQFFGDEIVSKLRFGLELSDEDINVISDLQEKWDGVVNGTTSPDFTHASIEDKNKIKSILDHLK